MVASLASPAAIGDQNGNNDSGYAASQPDAVFTDSPRKQRQQTSSAAANNLQQQKKNGVTAPDTEMR